MNKNSRRGNALMMGILVLAALGGLGTLVAYQADNGIKYRQELDLGTVRGAMLARIQGIQMDYDSWVTTLAAHSPAYQKCLVDRDFTRCHDDMVSGSSDNNVIKAVAPSQVWQAATWDLSGQPLGGTEASPVTYDSKGNPCQSGTSCIVRFQVFSYMAQSGADGSDPDFVQFYFKLVTADPNTAPLFTLLNLGQSWKQSVTDTCPNGIARVTPDGKAACAAIPAITCPDGHYLAGFDSSGAYLCRRFQ